MEVHWTWSHPLSVCTAISKWLDVRFEKKMLCTQTQNELRSLTNKIRYDRRLKRNLKSLNIRYENMLYYVWFEEPRWIMIEVNIEIKYKIGKTVWGSMFKYSKFQKIHRWIAKLRTYCNLNVVAKMCKNKLHVKLQLAKLKSWQQLGIV